EDGIRDFHVTGVQTCALPILTTRLAIDALRSARRRRERYVGVWLPEPWLVDEGADPARRVEQDETLSMAFLVVVETLGPVERARSEERRVGKEGSSSSASKEW